MGLARSPRTVRVIFAFILASVLSFAPSTFAGSIVGWGTVAFDSGDLASKDFVAITGGFGHYLALKSDGSIVGWGAGQYGQATPPEGDDFVAIAAGRSHSLALRSDGSVVGWGSNTYPYGFGGSAECGQAAPPEGNDFVAIAAGGLHSLALKSDGSIVGWGAGTEDLGRDPDYGQATPPEGDDFVAVAAGGLHSLALKSDGSIVGWGGNDYGQATPPEGNDFVAVAAGEYHSLALKSDGSIVGWGSNDHGKATPPDGNDFVAVAAGGSHSLALKSDGSIVGWGDNWFCGQATPPEGNDFVAIAAGSWHSVALKSDGSLARWGAAPGWPARDNMPPAGSLPAGSDFVAVASAVDHCLALKSDGSIFAWGWDRAPDGNDYVAIAVGGERLFGVWDSHPSVAGHSFALKGDGSLVVWGDWEGIDPPAGNDFTAIAAGGAGDCLALRSDGSLVGGGAPEGNDFVAIATGPRLYGHSLALKSDGSIVGWGSNNYGEATAPEGDDYVAIAAGGTLIVDNQAMPTVPSSYSAYSLALRRDGSIVGWGDNSAGWATPPDGNDFVAIAGGPGDPLALRSDGSIVSWGDGHATPPEGNDFVAIAVGTTCSLAIREPRKFSGGSGTADDPYQIATAADLIALGETPDDYDKHFILTADIDLDPNLPGRRVFDRAVIAPDVNNATGGFQGTPFTGVFDGGGHTVSHMTMTGASRLGLFGQLGVGAAVRDLATLDVDMMGSGEDIGALAGWCNGPAHVIRCVATGEVAGNSGVGGLVGRNEGTLSHCFSAGLVGGNYSVGGLVGYNNQPVVHCYSTTAVTGERIAGGLVAYNMGSVIQCYSVGEVRGSEQVGGLVGLNREGSVISSLWDMQTSGQTWSAGGTGLTTVDMQAVQTYLDAGWDFLDSTDDGVSQVWQMPEGGGYPALATINGYTPPVLKGRGTLENPYIISDALELGAMVHYNPYAHYQLTASIDLSNLRSRAAVIPWFEGTFNGNGRTISQLTLTGESYLGLFGQLGWKAEVRNLGVTDVSITALGGYVGSLAGYNLGSISTSYSTGTVGGSENVGGLVGKGYGEIARSYSTCMVAANENAGGLVGANLGSVTECYSAGAVVGSEHTIGGLVGRSTEVVWFNVASGSARDCFWDIETSGQLETAGGGIGLTTAEMQTASTFLEAGWDFVDETENGTDDIWWILEGQDYPRLWWELIPEN